jgi:hypothetical protein
MFWGTISIMTKRGDYDRLRRHLAAMDPLVVEAADEVDPALIQWALSLTPWERLCASADALRFLSGFHRGTSRPSQVR